MSTPPTERPDATAPVEPEFDLDQAADEGAGLPVGTAATPPVRRRRTKQLNRRLVMALVRLMARLPMLRRPLARLMTGMVVAFAGIQFAKWLKWPNAELWAWGGPLMVVFWVLAALTTVGRLATAVDYKRLLDRRHERLQEASYATARMVVNDAALRGSDIAVFVWAVSGPPGLRWLSRAAAAESEPRRTVAILWTKGRGPLGRAWAQNEQVIEDLEDLRTSLADEDAYSQAAWKDRYELEWHEFRELLDYTAVLEMPLTGRNRLRRPVVKGVLELVAYTPQARTELHRVASSPQLAMIARICETML
jgi:hypothetical protein